MKKNKKIINSTQVILASSSQTRINIVKKYFSKVRVIEHKVDESEEKEKNKKLNAAELAKFLAKKKARSIIDTFKNSYIIGCDQTLECNEILISKPRTLRQAKENLMFLSGKEHRLYTCLYVLKNAKRFFSEETMSHLYLKNISESQIEKYIKENKKTVLSCIGSYKIEDNQKYKFLKIIEGKEESIMGFPIKNFVEKVQREGL